MFSVDFANVNEMISNHIIPFTLYGSSVRGRLIRLESQLHTILSGHRYPPVIAKALGELIVNTSMIGSMIKLDGIISIQISSTGPVSFMNADYTFEGHVRGYAKIKESELLHKIKLPENQQPNMKEIFGEGRMVVTIETKNSAPYQAIIPLTGKTITDNIVNYFRSSDQLDAGIAVLVKKVNKKWRAGGILIQKVAQAGGHGEGKSVAVQNKLWKKATWALANLDHISLCQANMVPDQFLESLFGTKELALFSGTAVQAKCRCSRERMCAALAMLSKDERKGLLKKGIYPVTCQICHHTENFTEEQVVLGIKS